MGEERRDTALQGVAPAVHARGMGARVQAEVGGAVPRVAGHGVGRARCRPIARAVGDVRGERARPEFRLEGAKAGVPRQACAGARGKFARNSWCWARRVGSGRGREGALRSSEHELTIVTLASATRRQARVRRGGAYRQVKSSQGSSRALNRLPDTHVVVGIRTPFLSVCVSY